MYRSIFRFGIEGVGSAVRQCGSAAATTIQTPSALIFAEINIDCDKSRDSTTSPIIGNHRVCLFPVFRTSVVSDFLVNMHKRTFTAICDLSRFATWGWMHLYGVNLKGIRYP